MKDVKLNPKQLRFCQEYVIDLNGKQAAIRAGYSAKTAEVAASKLLRIVKVQEKIQELNKKVSDKCELDAEWVRNRFKMISDRCVQEVPVMRFDHIEKAMVQVTEENENGEEVGVYQFDSSGANKATEMIGKMVGAFEKDNNQKKIDLSDFSWDKLLQRNPETTEAKK